VTDKQLLTAIEAQQALMIAVATGGPRIEDVNGEYRTRRASIQQGLRERALQDPNPHSDLWAWYGRWSSGDLPSYQSRREYIREMYEPLIAVVQRGPQGAVIFAEPTGWPLVDRQLGEVRERLAEANTEERFQAVGLLCRETLISLAQTVFDAARHPTVDGVAAGKTDASRMLEAYLNTELCGGSNEEARAHAKAALKFALALQHKRTADFRTAALCSEAVASIVNLIAILSGRRG
jgi:hypothetical protein